MDRLPLFKALMEGRVPEDGSGRIFIARFHTDSNYAIFEIIAYSGARQILKSDDGVTMKTDGYKIYIVYEPRTYPLRHMEPYLREENEKIPLRWDDLETVTLAGHDRVFITKQPYISMGSFNVEAPAEGNFVEYFFENQGTDEALCKFLKEILSDDFQVERKNIAPIIDIVKKNLEFFHREKEASA